jgi:hypothetical protein
MAVKSTEKTRYSDQATDRMTTESMFDSMQGTETLPSPQRRGRLWDPPNLLPRWCPEYHSCGQM